MASKKSVGAEGTWQVAPLPTLNMPLKTLTHDKETCTRILYTVSCVKFILIRVYVGCSLQETCFAQNRVTCKERVQEKVETMPQQTVAQPDFCFGWGTTILYSHFSPFPPSLPSLLFPLLPCVAIAVPLPWGPTPYIHLEGLRERCKLPQRVRCARPSGSFWCILCSKK